jgi:uncharacterized protein
MTGRQTAATRRDGSFDAMDMAARGLEVAGTVHAADLPRVADQWVDGPGEGAATVAWRITGAADALGRAALAVTLDGAVMLECQRCLRPFSWKVAQQTVLLLARDAREMASLDEQDEHEVIVADGPLEPRVLVEDELLLTLPFAPLCGRGDCITAALNGDRRSGSPSAEDSSPFSALAALKTRPARKPKA